MKLRTCGSYLVGLVLSTSAVAQVQSFPTSVSRAVKSPLTNQVQRALLRSTFPAVRLYNRPSASHLSPAFLAQSALPQDKQTKILQATRPGVFHIPTQSPVHQNLFSGGIFEVETDGKPEIFGIITMHALPHTFQYSSSVQRYFYAIVDTQQGPLVIPAEVVQLSAQESLDVALVKFRPEDEPYLHPLTLAPHNPRIGEELYAQGIAKEQTQQTTLSVAGYTSIGLGTTHLTADFCSTNRAGFCGSPAVDEHGNLAGVHIGRSFTETIGYITPVQSILFLVQAYHNPSAKPVEIELAGKAVVQLGVDEYISRIDILDENRRSFWTQQMIFKTSLRPVQEMLQKYPQASFVRLEIRRSTWKQEKKGWMIDNQTNVRTIEVKLENIK